MGKERPRKINNNSNNNNRYKKKLLGCACECDRSWWKHGLNNGINQPVLKPLAADVFACWAARAAVWLHAAGSAEDSATCSCQPCSQKQTGGAQRDLPSSSSVSPCWHSAGRRQGKQLPSAKGSWCLCLRASHLLISQEDVLLSLASLSLRLSWRLL